MNFSNLISLLSLSVIFFLFSCNGSTSTDGENTIKVEQINGNWQVAEATRDGQTTETLDGLFFRFSPSGQLSTNLLGSESTFPFELSANKIIQKSTPPLEYTIEEVSDTLILSTQLEGMNFKLTLAKGE